MHDSFSRSYLDKVRFFGAAGRKQLKGIKGRQRRYEVVREQAAHRDAAIV